MKIVFTGGGTAGHVMPNVALIEQLQEEIFYIGTNGMEKQLVAPLVKSGKVTEFLQIDACKLKRKFALSNLLVPFRLAKSIAQAKKHLAKIQPDVVFSKGGFVGLPVVVASKMLGIPAIVHESDLSMGLANKISSKFSTTLSAFPIKNATRVGAIVRNSIKNGNKKQGLETMGFDGRKPVLTVVGGSLGAQSLVDAICQNSCLAEQFDIFVVTGNKTVNCNFAHQAQFVHNFGDVLSATDVCLTRAGANALAELTIANVPFVAVPLTKQSRGEQVQNARWFEQQGCGIVLNDSNLQQNLQGAVLCCYNNRHAFVAKQKQLNIDGTSKVLDYILQHKVG